MINAREAWKMTKANVDQRTDKITKMIDDSVTMATRDCRYYANVYATQGISVEMIQTAAETLGYVCKINRAHDQRDTSYVELKWATP